MEVNKKQISIDAWLAKKFMVLVKRKLQRGQVPRQPAFKSLMSAVFPIDSSDGSDGDDGDDVHGDGGNNGGGDDDVHGDGGNNGGGGDGPDGNGGLGLAAHEPEVFLFFGLKV